MRLQDLMTPFMVLLISQILGLSLAIKHGQNLIWTQKPVTARAAARIVGINGDPSEWVNTGNVDVRHISAPQFTWLFRGIGYLFRTQTMYWSESKYKRIQGITLNGTTVTVNVFTGTSAIVDGLTVDWLSNNVYWTDALYNWIIMMPLKNSKSYRFVVNENLEQPHGVAVYPSKGYLFWTDWGKLPKIETSDLTGNNRRQIVSTHLMHPQGLTVDFEENRLYWVDSKKDTIESVEFNGNGRRLVAMELGTNFYGIALYSNYLFITEQGKGHLKIFDKTTGNNQINYQLGYIPFGIVMYDESMQPGNSSACDSKGCEHMCVNDPLLGPTCVCGTGYNINGTECIDQRRFHQPSHFYAIKSAICQYPANLADMSLHGVTITTQCFLNNKRGYLALAYDSTENMLYYSENTTKSIQRVELEKGSSTQTVSGGSGVVEGLALDWAAGNLYWTDSGRKEIRVSKKTGLYQTTLINTDLEYPLGIAVHPKRGKLYWSDRGSNPKIEEADLNGEGRKVLDVGALRTPNHIYVDVRADVLYWSDSEMNHIGSYDLNTQEKTVVYSDPSTDFFGVSIFKDYVLWTATGTKNGVHAAIRATGEKVRGIVHPKVGQAADVITFDPENQPDVNSPCSDSNGNGGCQQLCLQGMNNETKWCYCGLGYELDENGQTCSTATLKDYFLLLTDAYLKQIYQLGARDGLVRAISLAKQDRPIAIDYDPFQKRIYWTDNTANIIKTANIDGTYEQVIKVLPNNSVSDGIAIDYVSRLVYYSDAGTNIIGLISMVNTSLHSTIISDNLDEPRAIVLDPQRGIMFWTDWGKKPRIETANMDGKGRNILLNLQESSWPNGLALDTKEKRLYWLDAKFNKIESITTEGQDRKTLIEETENAHYYDLSLMGDYLYITDWKRRSVMRMPKKGDSLERFGPERFGRLNGIHGYNSSEMPITRNWCVYHVCMHFCIPIPYHREVCACADGYGLAEDKKSCVLTTTVATTSTISTEATTTTTENTTMSAAVRSQSTVPPTTSTIEFIPSASPFTATFETTATYNNTDYIDVSVDPDSKVSESQQPEISDSGDSNMVPVIVGVTVTVLVVIVVGILIGIYIHKRRSAYNPHSPLKEDRRGDSFYQITFSDTKDELQFDSGIENPAFDYMQQDNNNPDPPL